MNSAICHSERRREKVRRQPALCGLDFLEVGPIKPSGSPLADQCLLRVYFLGKITATLDKSNVRIEGGRRIRDIQVVQVKIFPGQHPELDDCMEVTVDRPGDFSTYTLKVLEQDKKGKWLPHSAFDQRYNSIEFTFKADCPSDLDCQQNTACPPEPLPEPNISYLAKDYSSFRQLMLDRLSLTMPEWKERHVPDIGMALVEVLAYVGDHLSYYQDAVATEAYLDTARQRISVRRHARLVDYAMHEGCNARTWVAVTVDDDVTVDPNKDYFITGIKGAATVLSAEDLRQMQGAQYEVFEPMGDKPIKLWHSHNKIYFYTWGDKECCLRRGATSATLFGKLILPEDTKPGKPPCDNRPEPQQFQIKQEQSSCAQQDIQQDANVPLLHLQSDDVLIFEEVIGPKTGDKADANRLHRHVVRLTKVEAGVDRLDNTPVVEISWAEEDALPFPLCISVLGPPSSDCMMLENVSIARGNIILADHGRTVSESEEDLGCVALKKQIRQCKGEDILADQQLVPETYRPSLRYAPLIFSQPLPTELPAASVTLAQDARNALPWITLRSFKGKREQSAQSQTTEEPAPEEPSWFARTDLLSSGPDDRHFAVEMDNDGRAHLRFGDDELGEQPDAGLCFQATYRIGNGPAGNVGADAIAHLVLHNRISGLQITSVSNPLPAQGGTAPESLDEVKLFAPQTFRRELQRAVIADDYAAIVEREFKSKVQRAAARLRWNGSWHEVLVAVDPYGKEEADQELLDAVSRRLHRFRKIGHDVVVKAAQRVPLELEMQICVLPHYLRGHVKEVLLDIFSNRILPDGSRGFFHPDNLTFGDGIHLSRLIAKAQAVTGVESVQVTKLQRLNIPSMQAIEDGILRLDPFAIAQLDSDPNFPENGILKIEMRGGR